MEFYELLEKIINAIPSGYENIRYAAEAALPWILGICSAATCLFGHKIHKIWNAFFFFWIGFLVPVFIIGLLFKTTGFWMNALIVVGIICGAACAFYSKKLFKLQLFITTFIMVFTTLPSYLTFLGSAASVAVGALAALAAGILSTKYKYIITIITTSFSGSFMLFGVFEANVGLSHTAASALSVIAGIIGLGIQCYIERKELKETWEKLKEKKEKVKNFSISAKEKSTNSADAETESQANNQTNI